MERVLSETQYLWYVTMTSAAAILGGLLLWVGFIFMGFTARRFEEAYGQATSWRVLLAAPSGVFAYLVLQAAASLRQHNLTPGEQWLGYVLLAGSAGLCLWGVLRFRKVLRGIL